MRRRDFLQLSIAAAGSAALLRFSPTAEAASFLRRRNGEAPSPFTIVQLSDTHVGFQGPPDPLGTKAFEHAVDTINALDTQPDLVIFTGDLTQDSEDPAEHAKRMKTFRSIEDRLRVRKRYHVPGEHDSALDGGTLYREHFGESHYSFDHRGVHFIALDNVSAGRPLVGRAQIAWLKNDLARYPKSAPIIVFTHRPLFDLKPDWEWFTTDGDEVMNVLAPYDNVTVLYGHIHRVDHHTFGHAQHHAARSLIFAFPDPETAGEKKPMPFDASQPFRNLGIRQVHTAPASVDDIELSHNEIAGTNGIQRIMKGAFA